MSYITSLSDFEMSMDVERVGKRAAVLGLARSGRAVVQLLVDKGYSVYASDISENETILKSKRDFEQLGVDVDLGFHSEEKLKAADLIVISPGIDPSVAILSLEGIEDKTLVSEVEVASWYLDAPIVGITGTNGKTTTTSLLGFICRCGDVNVAVAGNIGEPLSGVVTDKSSHDWIVAELSSFQLKHIVNFHPKISVMLNLSPDHMDRYLSYDEYLADKSRIFDNQNEQDFAVLNGEDDEVLYMGKSIKPKKFKFHSYAVLDEGVFLQGDEVVIADRKGIHPVCHLSEISLPGPHNLQNSLAAAGAAYLMGIHPEVIREGITTFTGVENRLERVATIGGVVFVNDSKATNTVSVEYALKSFHGGLILIMGGKDKGIRYTPLRNLVKNKVKLLIVIGELKDKIIEDLGDVVRCQRCDSLEDAVEVAYKKADEGDVVLLSPGSSSFDMFSDYQERGKRFKDAVFALGRKSR